MKIELKTQIQRKEKKQIEKAQDCFAGSGLLGS
jgi:hypothetical protein